jgi:monoterpene epsilon-lactone hydrolase
MPSVPARAVNLAFRYTVKPTFRRSGSVQGLRRLALRFDRIAGRPVRSAALRDVDVGRYTATRISTPRAERGRTLLYLPGGGFVLRTPAVHRALVARICLEAHADALLAFYRLAPEHPFPAALDDCVAAYQYLVDEGTSPSRIVIGGDSAGGCLALATLMTLRDRGAALPAGAFTMSAVTDLRGHHHGSRTTNRDLDPVLSLDDSDRWHRYYLGDNPAGLSDPRVSPVLGNFTGLPSLLMQASTTEILLDDTRLAAERAREAGVECSLELFPGMTHVWQMVPRLPESRQAVQSIGAFIRHHTSN